MSCRNQNYENHRLNQLAGSPPPLPTVQPPILPLTERSKLARVKSLSKSPSKATLNRNARLFEKQKDVRCSDITFQEFNREKAEETLRLKPVGTYMVRTGGKGKNKAFALSLKTNSSSGFDHYRIEMTADSFFIEEELKFTSFSQLIAKYQQEKLPVLAAQLLYPLVTAGNFHRVYSSTLFSPDTFQIINHTQPIGRGEFGKVFAAHWPDEQKQVAIKEINLPLLRTKNSDQHSPKVLPVRLDEFSEIRLLKTLFNEKATYHNILEHYGHG